MRLWSLLAIWLSPLWRGAVFGQSVLSHSGQVQGWEGGEADIIPIPDVNVPFYRLAPPPDASSVGTIAADGTFTISIPEGMAPVQLRPAGRALTGCSLDADPEDARVVWLEYGAHRADGRLIGIIFRASAPAWGEAEPGEHSIVTLYAEEAVTMQGNPARGATEAFDIQVEPGWNEILQTFHEHPDRPGERLDPHRRSRA